MSFVLCRVPCHLPFDMCHVSCVVCRVSCVVYHVPCVMCRLSCVMCIVCVVCVVCRPYVFIPPCAQVAANRLSNHGPRAGPKERPPDGCLFDGGTNIPLRRLFEGPSRLGRISHGVLVYCTEEGGGGWE